MARERPPTTNMVQKSSVMAGLERVILSFLSNRQGAKTPRNHHQLPTHSHERDRWAAQARNESRNDQSQIPWRSWRLGGSSFVPELRAIDGVPAEVLFDSQQAVVFGDAVAARGAAGLDLA